MSGIGGPPFGAAPGRREPPEDQPPVRRQPTPWMPPHAATTPNAERYLLEADALRRRQLHSALLHGSSRTWRDRRRIWPAMVAGAVVVAVVVAVFTVVHALQAEQERQDKEEGQQSSAGVLGAAAVERSMRAMRPAVGTV